MYGDRIYNYELTSLPFPSPPSISLSLIVVDTSVIISQTPNLPDLKSPLLTPTRSTSEGSVSRGSSKEINELRLRRFAPLEIAGKEDKKEDKSVGGKD